MKIDRRARYTRMALIDALAELMQTQHVSRISVKALCEKADINRSTFYAHFTDQFDLLRQIEQEVMDNLRRYIDAQGIDEAVPISEQVLTSILDYVKENDKLFRALLSENCDIAIQKDIIVLAQLESVQYQEKLSGNEAEYMMEFWINGCISIIHRWMGTGMQESTGEMSRLMLRVMYHGMFGLIGEEI